MLEQRRLALCCKSGKLTLDTHLAGRVDAFNPAELPIGCEILVDSDESKQRLALLHGNVRIYGMVFGTARRAPAFPCCGRG